MNVNLQTCNSCFKSETLSCWSTKILMLCFLGFYRNSHRQYKSKGRRGRRKRGKIRIVPELWGFFLSFSGEVKSTSKELRLKYDVRDLAGPELGRVSWCGSLPSETRQAVHDLGHDKYGSTLPPEGSEWRTRAAGGGGPERGAMQKTKHSNSPTERVRLPNDGELGEERMF